MESCSMWSRCVFNNKSYLLKMQKKKKVWCFFEVYVVVDVGTNSLQLSDLSNNTVTVSNTDTDSESEVFVVFLLSSVVLLLTP